MGAVYITIIIAVALAAMVIVWRLRPRLAPGTIVLAGAALYLAGYAWQPGASEAQFYVKEAIRILGLVGIGVGIGECFRNVRRNHNGND